MAIVVVLLVAMHKLLEVFPKMGLIIVGQCPA